MSFPLVLHITFAAAKALLSQHKEVSVRDRQVTTLLIQIVPAVLAQFEVSCGKLNVRSDLSSEWDC